MHPTLLTIGRLSVPTYTVLLDLGLVIALLMARVEGRRLLGKDSAALDASLWAVVAGLFGGRIGYAGVNWSAFADDPGRLLRVWEGGLSFHGASVAGIMAVVAFAWLHGYTRADSWHLLDALTPALATAVLFGWAACLAAGCAYGAPGQGLGYFLLPDLYGVEASRFATQAAGFVLSFVLLFATLALRSGRLFPGILFVLYLFLYFAGNFFLGFTRGDESIYLGPWRFGQVVDLFFIFGSAAILLTRWVRARSEPVSPPTDQEPDPGGPSLLSQSGHGAAKDRA